MILSEDAEMAVPQGLLDTINFQCRKKAKEYHGTFKFDYALAVELGNVLSVSPDLNGSSRRRRESMAYFYDSYYYYGDDPVAAYEDKYQNQGFKHFSNKEEDIMLFDLALDLPEFEVAEGETDSGRSAVYGLPFSVRLNMTLSIRGRKNLNMQQQNLAQELFQNCTTDLKEHFEGEIATDENLVTAGDNVASQMESSDILWNCPKGKVQKFLL